MVAPTCRSVSPFPGILLAPYADIFVVYRVSWLRAKARLTRWSEELQLVAYEMQWTVNWFRRMEEDWELRCKRLEDGIVVSGLDCYCYKQIAMWRTLADQAHDKFSVALGRPLFWD